jgi:ABC-2 type transport system ATP-binding protein
MNAILSVRDVVKRFGQREALAGVSFELLADTTTVLLGSNGAGKSTLMRCVLGSLAPERGATLVLGRNPLRDATFVRRAIGYVPDEPDVYGWMTARELMRFLREHYPTWSDERAARLLERLEVPQNTRFDAMSRGEAAKAMLAAALAPAPQLIVLDEPFARLAPPVRDEVLRVFVEEAPFEGGAALVATHDLEVAARIADRVLVLDQGKLSADVELDQLLAARDGATSLPEALRALYPQPSEELALR